MIRGSAAALTGAFNEMRREFATIHPYGPDTRPARVSTFRKSYNQPCRGRLSRRPACFEFLKIYRYTPYGPPPSAAHGTTEFRKIN